jgi:transposase
MAAWRTRAANSIAAHRVAGGGFGGRGASLPVSALREEFRCLPPFARAYAHHTNALARFVCDLSHWMTLSEVAALSHLGWDTVKEIVKADLARRYGNVSIKEVKRIAIDEIYVGRKAKFLTLVIDLDTGQIIHVAKGRGQEALRKFWRRVRKSKARIEAAACDMSAAYWSAIMEHLPQAALVFDHFHIIKLANEKIDDLRRALWHEADILKRNAIKGSRYLLLMGAENLPDDRREKLQEALRFNEPLSVAYYLKEELRLLWSQPSFEHMSRFLHNWCAKALETGIVQMMSLAKTLRAHATGILNFFHHPISSGKLEGINNKIACLKRAAYGYRDHEFFTLKLYSLHESSIRLSGL